MKNILAFLFAGFYLSCCSSNSQPGLVTIEFYIAHEQAADNSRKIYVSSDHKAYYISEHALLTNQDIARADLTFMGNRPAIEIIFTPPGRNKLSLTTKQNLTKRLAVLIDNEAVCAPVIEAQLMGGRFVFQGDLRGDDIRRIAAGINKSLQLTSETQINYTDAAGTLQVNGALLPYYFSGHGKTTCLVVHDMRPLIDGDLQNHFSFVHLKNRTEVPTEGVINLGAIRLNTFIDDIECLRRRLNLSDFTIMGHSLFGFLAIEYARRYPQYISHIILICTPPSTRYLKNEEYWITNAPEQRKKLLAENYTKISDDYLNTLSSEQRIIARILADAPRMWYDPTYDASWLYQDLYVNEGMLQHFVDTILGNYRITGGNTITIPVFLVLGRYDYQVPHILWDEYHDFFPTFTFHLFKQSGHFPMVEEATLFNQKLLEWMNVL
jgi:proline iminopeptidase